MIDPSVQHPTFEAHMKVLRTCYDAFNGHVRNPTYIPRLSDQQTSEYEAYVGRPFYLNATERTVQSVIGVMMKEEPVVINGPITVADSLDFNAFIQDAIMDLCLGGRLLLTVDVDASGQPYLQYYPSQNIINWSSNFIMLQTTREVPDKDNPYKLNTEVVWKELFIDAEGYHSARYWMKVSSKKFVSTEPVRLILRGQPVTGLAVSWVTPYDNTTELYNPPVKSVAELNVAHFRLSCDHYNGLHFLAVPTLYAQGELMPSDTGVPQQKIVLGSTTSAPHFTSGGSLDFAEYSGTGLGSLSEEKDRIELLMNEYGAQLIAPKQAETATAVSIRAVSQTATLETMSNAIESGINRVLEWYSIAAGKEVSVELNDTFLQPEVTEPTATTAQNA